jgi:signal transduction histidine kinase
VFDLREAIDRAVEMTAPLYSERHHTLDLHIGTPMFVLGDVIRMSQVFANLLSNAAKYTQPGGRVTLSTRVDNDTVVVECRDNGIGIDSNLIPRVFDLFVQGEPDFNRHEGGLGLGLALVRALVEQHGGSVEAHSDGIGRGSTFILRLPSAGAAV